MSDERINVTKSFLPPINEYEEYLQKIWSRNQLTNQGPLLKEFEKEIKSFLSADNFHFVSNGTVALQLALRGLGITEGEIITTPFTYVATISSILWERCRPVFVDINPDTLCIDPELIEGKITKDTKAIMPVHVFGNACDIEKIDAVAKKHKLKVIYDGAHAFGARYKEKSLLDFGDITICSFHATKPFHTIEGGGLVVRDRTVSERIELIKRFGHHGDEHYMLGMNAKASEFHAAMGLCNLKYIDKIIEQRKNLSTVYDRLLTGALKKPAYDDSNYNYAYYPVVFESEEALLRAKQRLEDQNIYPRRYFFPSLNLLPYLEDRQSCPVSEDIAVRILCLPLYYSLQEKDVRRIADIITI